MTYAELVTQMQDFLENEEASFVSNIPNLVRQAEAYIYGRVRTPDQRLSVTGTWTAATFVTPSDFVEPLMLYPTGGTPLTQREESFLVTVYGSTMGTPIHYAIKGATSAGTTIRLAPIPTSTAYTMDYIGAAPSVVTSSTTWLSLNFPNALLYGSLAQGEIYNKGNRDYKSLFDEAIAELIRSAEGLMLEDEYRDQAVKEGI